MVAYNTMNKLLFILAIYLLISYKNNKPTQSNAHGKDSLNALPSKVVEDTTFSYDAQFIIENFLVSGLLGEKDITIINEDCGIFMIPDSIQISKMKGKTPEDMENFYIAADDNSYYQYEARKFLDSLKIKAIYPKTRYLKFIINNNTLFFDSKSKYTDGWIVVLFIGNRKPKIVDFVSFKESYNKYINEQ